MAIIKSLPGVEVTVMVDGEDLIEHADTEVDAEPRITTQYVEATTGARFAIKIKIAKWPSVVVGNCLDFRISLDGNKSLQNRVFIKDTVMNLSGETKVVEGVSKAALYPFEFAALKTSEAGRRQDASRSRNLGNIVVGVHDMWTIRRDGTTADLKDALVFIKAPDVLSEKALKGEALSHTTTLGLPLEEKPRPVWRCRDATDSSEPVATLRFTYRSLVALKTMHIIARTPSPMPLEDRDPETLTHEEAITLLKRNKEAEAARIKIKREDQDTDERVKKRPRLSQGGALLEIEEDGSVRESSASTLAPAMPTGVIELD